MSFGKLLSVLKSMRNSEQTEGKALCSGCGHRMTTCNLLSVLT